MRSAAVPVVHRYNQRRDDMCMPNMVVPDCLKGLVVTPDCLIGLVVTPDCLKGLVLVPDYLRALLFDQDFPLLLEAESGIS